MNYDFTKFDITNPGENEDEFRSWQIQVNWIMLNKIEDILATQNTVPEACPFMKFVTWAKLSAAIGAPVALIIGGIYTLVKLFGGT